MKIEVTQKDIIRAINLRELGRGDVGERCPVALAIKRKTHHRVRVGLSTARVIRSKDGGEEKYTFYLLSKSAQKLIHDFDSHGKPKPTTFKMKVC